MVIQMKSLSAMSAIKQFGVSQQYFDFLGNNPDCVTVSLTSQEFTFKYNREGDLLIKTVPVSFTTLHALHSGKLGALDASKICGSLTAVLIELVGLYSKGKLQPLPSGTLSKLPPLTVSQTPIGTPELTAAPVHVPGAPVPIPAPPYNGTDYSPLLPSEMVKAPTIPLVKATRLYQPVDGTSAGSRYYLIAANQNLKVAIRWLNNVLSVRTEGALNSNLKGKLTALGFSFKSSDYSSMHLNCNDKTMAYKAVGAILFASGQNFLTPMPNLTQLYGA